jgi:hypothetical protein
MYKLEPATNPRGLQMPAKNQDFEHWAGNAKTLKFGPVLDRNGQLVDLTACQATWTLAKKPTSAPADIVVAKSTADPSQMEITEGPPGNFYLLVYLTKDDTKSIKQASYYHEATIIEPTGKPVTITIGKMTLYQTLIAEMLG